MEVAFNDTCASGMKPLMTSTDLLLSDTRFGSDHRRVAADD